MGNDSSSTSIFFPLLLQLTMKSVGREFGDHGGRTDGTEREVMYGADAKQHWSNNKPSAVLAAGRYAAPLF